MHFWDIILNKEVHSPHQSLSMYLHHGNLNSETKASTYEMEEKKGQQINTEKDVSEKTEDPDHD